MVNEYRQIFGDALTSFEGLKELNIRPKINENEFLLYHAVLLLNDTVNLIIEFFKLSDFKNDSIETKLDELYLSKL
jgi:hypothetical protein